MTSQNYGQRLLLQLRQSPHQQPPNPKSFTRRSSTTNAEYFGLGLVPQLSWSVAWFMAAPITSWPLLLDLGTVDDEFGGNVRYWHKADIPTRSTNVRFWG